MGKDVGQAVAPVAGATSEPIRNTLGGDPVSAIMHHRTLALSFTLLAVIAACSQMPSRPSDGDASGVRYLDAAALTSGDEYSDAQVLTTVALQHVSAADAEARLQANLPEGVRVSRVGEANQLLIQGRGQAVTESIREIKRIDVR